eukprot:TRINITY_DN3841_c0_g1_i1.p1 TRINITY_DN3841_c0_g1~~TRINITY_DN3841_c0_g1_i1.p1  ORF type:complete len:468 (-),score=141.04 TRINITY_DN3841_c0_g1_i1:86-1489(-)
MSFAHRAQDFAQQQAAIAAAEGMLGPPSLAFQQAAMAARGQIPPHPLHPAATAGNGFLRLQSPQSTHAPQGGRQSMMTPTMPFAATGHQFNRFPSVQMVIPPMMHPAQVAGPAAAVPNNLPPNFDPNMIEPRVTMTRQQVFQGLLQHSNGLSLSLRERVVEVAYQTPQPLQQAVEVVYILKPLEAAIPPPMEDELINLLKTPNRTEAKLEEQKVVEKIEEKHEEKVEVKIMKDAAVDTVEIFPEEEPAPAPEPRTIDQLEKHLKEAIEKADKFINATSPEQPQQGIKDITNEKTMTSPTSETYATTKFQKSSQAGNLPRGLNFDGKGNYDKKSYPNGDVYEGEIIDGKRIGYGVLYYASGEKKYEGRWEDDAFSGQGRLYNKYATEVDEDFSFDFKDFAGLKDYWMRYEGQFAKGRIDGVGTIYLVNDQKFTGTFRKGKVHGDGVFYKPDGQIIFGKWSMNRLCPQE